MNLRKRILFLLIFALPTLTTRLYSWSDHTLIAYPVFVSMPEIADKQVKATSLESFLLAIEKPLEKLLQEEEKWMQENLFYYPPLPSQLTFRATGNAKDIRTRFIHAIRLNPASKLRLYLQLTPFQESKNPKLTAKDIATFKNLDYLSHANFVSIQEGEKVKALDVLVTANDEPDHGLDIGLYSDNNTEHGKIYGCGTQPFGNANLEYSSQAPVHMGFYHESSTIFFMAGFLKRTLPEYRIHIYRRLAQLAFKNGQDYWGYRFMGWGLHYIGDFTNPFHVRMSPNAGTGELLYKNFLDTIAISGPKTGLVQLLSNRHTAIEKFQEILMRRAFQAKNSRHTTYISLNTPIKNLPAYKHEHIINMFARSAFDKAEETNDILVKLMPEKFVSDTEFELGTSPEQKQIIEKVEEHSGKEGVEKMTEHISNLLKLFSKHGRIYVKSILK